MRSGMQELRVVGLRRVAEVCLEVLWVSVLHLDLDPAGVVIP